MRAYAGESLAPPNTVGSVLAVLKQTHTRAEVYTCAYTSVSHSIAYLYDTYVWMKWVKRFHQIALSVPARPPVPPRMFQEHT